MQIIVLKSKIHNIRVTEANIHYEGSITIDRDLLDRADIAKYEQVHVLNVTNGKRFITYAIDGTKDEICVNGAAAKLVEIGNELIVLAYGITENKYITPRIIKPIKE